MSSKSKTTERAAMLVNVYREPVDPPPSFEAMPDDGKIGGADVGERIDECLARFRAGDALALIDAFKWCATLRVVPPDWVLFEAGRAFALYTTAHARTLDEAFRVARRKGEKIEGTRNTIMLTNCIRLAVDKAHDNDGRPISPDLFDEVGEAFGISASTCAELYYGR